MHAQFAVTPSQLPEVLLNVAVVRPVFLLWGAPGIGKSSLVREFANSLGLECVSLLGTQLAPEDLVGVPQIVDGRSRFCPPEQIARDKPYCLFLDELNAASPDVQKAFYSLILDRRIGNYELPPGSVVIGAGNRATDQALARPMASALINRLVHVHLRASAADWLAWATGNEVHPWIVEYLTQRPDHLWSAPPKSEEPFSTPRSWHMLSDLLRSYGDPVEDETIGLLAYATLTPQHAGSFRAYLKVARHAYDLEAILKGDARWPAEPGDRDLLYFLAETFRAAGQGPAAAGRGPDRHVSGAKAKAKRRERREKAMGEGWQLVRSSVVLGYLAGQACLTSESLSGVDSWAVVNQRGAITANRSRDGEPAEWAWVFAHLLLHLGLGHLEEDRLKEAAAVTRDREIEAAYGVACCVAVHRFAEVVRLGSTPLWLPEMPGNDDLALARRWRETGVPELRSLRDRRRPAVPRARTAASQAGDAVPGAERGLGRAVRTGPDRVRERGDGTRGASARSDSAQARDARVGPGTVLVPLVVPAARRDGRRVHAGRRRRTREGVGDRHRRGGRRARRDLRQPVCRAGLGGVAVCPRARDAARRAAPRPPRIRPRPVPVERRLRLRDQRLAGREVLHRGLPAET